jgi:hypothetical protein
MHSAGFCAAEIGVQEEEVAGVEVEVTGLEIEMAEIGAEAEVEVARREWQSAHAPASHPHPHLHPYPRACVSLSRRSYRAQRCRPVHPFHGTRCSLPSPGSRCSGLLRRESAPACVAEVWEPTR